MNKKTYINEENQIRLKPDVDINESYNKAQEQCGHACGVEDFVINGRCYKNGCMDAYLAASPTYQKQGDWSAYKIGEEISEDEVETCECSQCLGQGWTVEAECCRRTDGPYCCGYPDPVQVQCEHCHATGFVAIPKKKEVVEERKYTKEDIERAIQFGVDIEAGIIVRNYAISATEQFIIHNSTQNHKP